MKLWKTCSIMLVVVTFSTQIVAGSDSTGFRCDPPEPFNRFDNLRCWIDSQPYIPPTAKWPYPVSFIRPNPLPTDQSLRLKISMSGYSARPKLFCEGNDFSDPGHIVIKSCAGHYPDISLHQINGMNPMGWWGRYFGRSNSARLGLSLRKTQEWESAIDYAAGITLEGTSYGGIGAILQSLMLGETDPVWQKAITRVHSNLADTLIVNPGNGRYFRDPSMRLAWGTYDPGKADIIEHSKKLKGVYYRVNGSPKDTAVRFDLDFFRKFCNEQKIACFGTWHNAGHNLTEPGINLPFLKFYSSSGMDTRLDQPLPVFTNSTANHWGARGHYNLGLEWLSRNIVDKPNKARLPIRYRRHVQFGGAIPDQPRSATFDLTLRRFQKFRLKEGDHVSWTLGGQSGFATVQAEGEITLEKLTLASGDGYTKLVLKREPKQTLRKAPSDMPT